MPKHFPISNFEYVLYLRSVNDTAQLATVNRDVPPSLSSNATREQQDSVILFEAKANGQDLKLVFLRSHSTAKSEEGNLIYRAGPHTDYRPLQQTMQAPLEAGTRSRRLKQSTLHPYQFTTSA